MAVCKLANWGRGRARNATNPPTKDFRYVRRWLLFERRWLDVASCDVAACSYLVELGPEKGAVADSLALEGWNLLRDKQTSKYGRGEDRSFWMYVEFKVGES
jgi:hypothetical protein